MKNQEKIASFLQSILSLVAKGFHTMCGSQILGTLFSVKPKVIYTKCSKHEPYTVAYTFDCVCSKMNN